MAVTAPASWPGEAAFIKFISTHDNLRELVTLPATGAN
jgi:hypothetical protein